MSILRVCVEREGSSSLFVVLSFAGILKEAGRGRVMRNGQNGYMDMCMKYVSVQKEGKLGERERERE